MTPRSADAFASPSLISLGVLQVFVAFGAAAVGLATSFAPLALVVATSTVASLCCLRAHPLATKLSLYSSAVVLSTAWFSPRYPLFQWALVIAGVAQIALAVTTHFELRAPRATGATIASTTPVAPRDLSTKEPFHGQE